MPHFKKKIEYYLIFLFFLLLLISLFIFKDYGISIDEESTRYHGLVSFNYILEILNKIFGFKVFTNPGYPALENYEFKEYGVIFELFAVVLEKIFFIDTHNNIFHFRHLLTNIFFIVGIIFFTKLIFENFNNIYLSLWSGLILYTSPRIFAHSFYNSKDIIFLTFFIISIYYTFEFLKKKKDKHLLLSCLALSFLTATRVIGIYFFIIFILFLLMEILENKKNKINFKIFLKILIVYFAFTYILWPFLWADPINNFIYALSSMSNYGWDGSVYYLGKFHNSYHLPWHYSLVWILVSNSVGIVVLLLLSLLLFSIRISKRLFNISDKNKNFTLWKSSREYFSYYNIILVLAPILLIILNNSTLYTGWRHLYFLFPSLLIICTSGIYYLLQLINKKNKMKLVLNIFCLFILLINIFNLIKFHPYQNVYFNFFIEKKANDNFEIDYWGLSNIEILKKIASKKKISNICNSGLMDLGMSKRMLIKKDRDFITIKGQDFNNCDYIISNKIYVSNPKYSKKYQIPDNFKKVDGIVRGNIVISSIYKKN